MDFLAEWQKRSTRPSKLSPFSVNHDRWDRRDYERLLAEVKDLRISQRRLGEKVSTGGPLYADNYFSLVKADPRLADPGEIRPSHLINRAVMSEATGLSEYEELRFTSVGDEIGSVLACMAMEPELLTLYDKLKTLSDLSKSLAKQEEAVEDLDAKIQELQENPDDLTPRDFQQNVELLNEQMEALLQTLNSDAQALQNELDVNSYLIRQSLKKAMRNSLDEIGGQDLPSWGLSPGQLTKLDPQRRILLAKQLNSDKMRRIADMIGRVRRLIFAEKTQNCEIARSEIYDLTLGNDLAHVLASEFRSLLDPVRKLDFYRRYSEGELVQYKLRGIERVARGGIYCPIDGSYSMAGAPEIWAKGVAIALLHLAKEQHREFYGMVFGGPGALSLHDFRDPNSIDFEAVIALAEEVFNGGTDFATPLSACAELLKEEYDEYGAVKGDIVFITDGECGVPEEWLKEFKELQAELDFRIFGVTIGGSIHDQPLADICDGRMYTISDLTTGNELKEVFKLI